MLGQANKFKKFISFDKFYSCKTEFQTIDVSKNNKFKRLNFKLSIRWKYYIKTILSF